MARRRRRPTDDIPVAQGADLTVINAVRGAFHQAERAKYSRMSKNRINFHAYLDEQDWSHKLPEQSRDFIPKVSTSVEQLGAFIKRALVQFGDYYSITLSTRAREVLSEEAARRLFNCFLEKMPEGNKRPGQKTLDFRTLVADGVKLAALESLMIFKIGGMRVDHKRPVMEPGAFELNEETGRFEEPSGFAFETIKPWRLSIGLVRPEDYYPDPSGDGMYEIHRCERDLHEVVRMANEGIYDPKAVALITDQSQRRLDQERRPSKMDQDEDTPPDYRKRVVIDEYWGTLLDADGRVVEENIVTAIANDRFLIRKPEPNPFWHQESPFIATPLVRVPFSVWHKALYDPASMLNLAINELFNLMLDGGISSVWGIKQLRTDDLADPSQVAGGIPQGATLAVKSTLPTNAKVLEKVAEGEIPGDAFNMYTALTGEFNQAALTNEIKLGQLPPRQVKATEIVEASQSQAVTLDSLSADIENEGMVKTMRLAWSNMLQNADDWLADDIVEAIGQRSALAISQMTPFQRYQMFTQGCVFKVNGLSATLGRVRDFQKTMALLQSVITNPLLLQAFVKRFSPDKTLDTLMRQLNINPSTIELTDEEREQLPQRMKELPAFQQLTNPQQGGGDGGPTAEGVGEPGLPAEINQIGNPLSGLGAGG